MTAALPSITSAIAKGGASALGALKIAAVPYFAVLALLFTFQRTIVFPRPSEIADPTLSGGRLIMLPASIDLLAYATLLAPPPSPAEPPPHLPPGLHVGSDSSPLPNVAAVYFPPPNPANPTLVYLHGNADQIGWGSAYLGRVAREQHGEPPPSRLIMLMQGPGIPRGRPERKACEKGHRLVGSNLPRKGAWMEYSILSPLLMECSNLTSCPVHTEVVSGVQGC